MKTEENPRSSRIAPGATVPSEYLAGLKKDPKRLPSKFFYDDRGSRLFDRICNLEEYYLTRSEFSILREKAESIAAIDRKSTRLNSSHVAISYAVFCLKKKKEPTTT